MSDQEGEGLAPPGSGSSVSGRPENRSINRIPVRLAVSHKGRSAPLGRTRDLSLQGVFIETREPLDIGAVIPLSIELEVKNPVQVQAEVVRKTPDGMGLRFHQVDKESSRRLRRWIVDHTSVAGSRRQVEQLRDDSAKIEPIRGAERIRALLEEIRGSRANLTFIPVERIARDYVRLSAIGADEVVFESADPSALRAGEDIYALLTLQFVSYSFELRVRSVDGKTVRCQLPDLVIFSERRTRNRVAAPPGTIIRWPSPTRPGVDVELPVLDLSDDGLSFRAPEHALLIPGTALEGASLVVDGRVRRLEAAEVRNLTVIEADGQPWLRVGVALGAARLGRATRAAKERVRPKTPIAKLIDKVRSAMSVVLHRGRERLAGPAVTSKRVIVRQGSLPIVGILDSTADVSERVAAPLVIVVPGFAGRKEQLSFLAGTLIEGFQRQNSDIAVLRIDGTNNLGESGKDPDCQGEGLHCMHYTVSGIVQDTLAALAWAKSNPHISPTHIVLVSVSMSSIGVRHVMTKPEAGDVSLWFSYMGAADAIDTVKNVSGNIDFHAYYMRGERVGYISLNGVLTDGDFFWKDLHEQGIGYLDGARAEMAKVRADVVWLRGRYDAFMDPRRVEALMRVPAEGARELIDVDSGHLPRTSDQALAQFVEITRRIWLHVNKSPMPTFTPSIGRLAVKAEAEWKAIRRDGISDRTEWWRRYLLDNDGVGFDILEYAPEYDQLMQVQVAGLFASERARQAQEPLFLELGAGTGNLSRRLVQRGARVIATDLVAEALASLSTKLEPRERSLLQTAIVDIEGSPHVAVKRFLAGDLAGPNALVERVPGLQRQLLGELLENHGDELHAALLGREVAVDELARRWRLSAPAQRLLADLNLYAQVIRGRLSAEVARTRLGSLPPSILECSRGLPFEDSSVDGVAMSLVLSYLNHPEDTVFEAWRVLRPGGHFVLSSLVHDSDSSRLYLDLVERLENLPEAELPAGAEPLGARRHLADSARRFVDHAAELYRLEEEGLFRFYDGDELASFVARRGFVDIKVERAFGNPPQAVVVTCKKA